MTFENRLSAFVKLGDFLNEQLCSKNAEFTGIILRASQENPWFTEENIRFALHAVVSDLKEKNLNDWTAHYPFLQHTVSPKTVAVIMAGNLPLVGFRDFLAVLVSGHKILCKLSSKDHSLLRYLAEQLIHIEPEFSERICFEERVIKGFDAVIATGGHHAVEHFYEYFSKYPHIIRGHRNSCAILEGTENTSELRGLFEDMFLYFGLGCRNVTKLFVPKNYDFQPLIDVVNCRDVLHTPLTNDNEKERMQCALAQHHLYQSNFQYQQVVSALNNRKTINANVFLLIENPTLTPPISVIHYEYYSNLAEVRHILETQKNQLQCIVSRTDTPFGQAQKPTLFDYADGMDTMKFLGSKI
ncbi:MAG: hypothetical protein LBP96_01890 [Bacteroidales bacterium]|jgi:hypothetical protein|nr:hypothetical protein [Bacteroidales bacterium]